VGPWEVGTVAEGIVRIEPMSEESAGGVPGVNTEIVVAFKRLLMSILVIVGRVSVDGRIVMEGIETDNGVMVREDGRPMLTLVGRVSVEGRTVIEGSEIDDGRIVKDDGNSVSVTGGNKVSVKLSITETTAEKLVTVAMPDMLGIDVTGIVFTIGLPSGPSSTARLANLTAVWVPLRTVPTGGLLKPVHVSELEQVSEQSK
jgi:hypothetical protein